MPEEAVMAVLPQDRRRHYGAAQELMQEKLEEHRAKYDGEGAFPHAVVLNLNWFPLRVENGHIQYVVDACAEGKDFAAWEIENERLFSQYRGSREGQTQGMMERDYDLFAISPVEQALEFHNVFNKGSASQRPPGGVVIFEGTRAMLADGAKVKVREPFWIQKGKTRIVKFREVLLSDLIADARKLQKVKILEKIAEGKSYADNPNKRNNLDDEHRQYARQAYRLKYITKLPDWCSESTTEANLCDGCGQEYKSKTGKCSCGHVMDPLLAYQKSVIEFGHVRMDALTPAEWKIAKELKEKRDKARGTN